MAKATKYILVLLAIALVFLGGYAVRGYVGTKNVPDNEQYRKTVDSLEQVIKQKNFEYDSLYAVRVSLETTIDDINEKIKALEKNYGQKVIDITTYTNPQLEQFFSDRYKD